MRCTKGGYLVTFVILINESDLFSSKKKKRKWHWQKVLLGGSLFASQLLCLLTIIISNSTKRLFQNLIIF
jgi:hypothetical protein